MRIHTLQHVPFEGLGSIEHWALGHGHPLSLTRLYAGDPLPALGRFDMLVILGGPMSIHDEADYPWLKAEKWFIRQVIDAGKPILGICLGAQLLGEALGAEVYPAGFREIGWFPINFNPAFAETSLGQALPREAEVLHWHGETFTLPEGALRIAGSTATDNQGFIWQGRIIALQCHLESTPLSVEALVENCADELDGSQWVQEPAQLLAEGRPFGEINRLMALILQYLATQVVEA